jgi:hypothetical protein
MSSIFVVIPYRDRPVALKTLLQQLLRYSNLKIIICEQEAGESFNRGWLKNVGFILSGAAGFDTVYFHDVDTIPGPKFVGYKESCHSVQHLYGHTHTLGGIVAVPAHLFIGANGFTNQLASWGGEDRLLYNALQPHVRRPHWTARFSDNSRVYEINEDGIIEDMRHFRARVEKHLQERGAQDLQNIDDRGDLSTTLFILQAELPTSHPCIRHFVVGKKTVMV